MRTKGQSHFPAFGDFFRRQAVPFMGSALLNHAGDFEAAPAEDFLDGAHGACGLFENQVEWPWGSARGDDDGLLSFQEGYRVPFFAVVHHSINPAVK